MMRGSAFVRFDHGRDYADQVAERLDEAGLTLARLPSSGLRPAAVKAMWPDIVPDWIDLLWPDEGGGVACLPTAHDIGRMDECLAWLSLIDGKDTPTRKVVNMRLIVHPLSEMHRFSWKKIGEKLGIGESTAKRWHRAGCQAIVRKLHVAHFS